MASPPFTAALALPASNNSAQSQLHCFLEKMFVWHLSITQKYHCRVYQVSPEKASVPLVCQPQATGLERHSNGRPTVHSSTGIACIQ